MVHKTSCCCLISAPDTAATTLYADILQRLQARIARWSGFRLSLLGRAHVAKQVLVAMFTYHGTFIPVPEQLLRQLCTSVYTFVAANRPVVAGAALLYPSRVISSRTLQQGGIALVDIRAQLTALQANIIGRFLEPGRIAWKSFFGSWLSKPLTPEQRLGTPSQQQHIWQLGRYFSFSFLVGGRSLTCQPNLPSQQYQRTAKGNLWDEGIHSTTHNSGSCFAMASDACVT